MRGIAVVARTQADLRFAPSHDFVPQAHRALVRDECQDFVAADRRVAGVAHALRPTGARAMNSARTKFAITASATVLPIARNTGIDDNASSENTSSAVRLQTMTACRSEERSGGTAGGSKGRMRRTPRT